MKRLLPFALLITMLATTALAAEGPVRHVVSFKFKKEAAPGAVKKVEDAFAALKKGIPFIQQLEWGTNISPEGHNKGFTHCWIVSFKNETDRDAYLVHAEHKAFVGLLKDVLDEAFVLDFIPKE